ncbi:GNAT family N-acetyltransferase [uncultured Bacteroides sp.]|uniref:GNAT family N-acetyltransferase n=1 Tax=uncultured Bacteroides sp. TaxID=162156 RepID=UPI002639354B|nr:GNAT family N-acetyltransferase [uncultured Bacteroides sp.]
MIRILHNTNQDYCLLVSYLHLVDKDFGIPLSQKQNLETYATKLLDKGIVTVVIENDEIVSCIGFYCNDVDNGIAYVSMLSTLSKTRGKGYAKLLIGEMIELCKKKRFKSIISSSINPVAISLYKSVGYEEIKKEIVDNKECVTLEYML